MLIIDRSRKQPRAMLQGQDQDRRISVSSGLEDYKTGIYIRRPAQMDMGRSVTTRPTRCWIQLNPAISKTSLCRIHCAHALVPLYRSVTYTPPFNGPFSGTTRVSRYQKGETNLDFTEARDSERQWHQLGHTQVCTSLQTDNHASTSPLSFLQAGCLSCRPTNSVKALKAQALKAHTISQCQRI